MPADDSISHRGASAIRAGRRFAPYNSTDSIGLKSHASCPALLSYDRVPLSVSTPEDSTLDVPSEISSTATLVNPSFDGH